MDENLKIKFCPYCKGKLFNDKKLAQGVKKCIHCRCNFFIILTSENNKTINL